MVSNSDLEKWHKAIQGIEAGQNDLSPNEWSAFQDLKQLFESSNFQAIESGSYIKVIKDALPSHNKNRLLQKAHLPIFIKLCELYFNGGGQTSEVPVSPVTPPLNIATQNNVPTFQPPTFRPPINQGEQQLETKVVESVVHPNTPTPPSQQQSPETSPVPEGGKERMVSNSDLEKWRKAIQGIEEGQKDLSSNEWTAFQALKQLFDNNNFQASESDSYIKIIKDALPSHNKHRLLQKAHLPTFIKLCEMFFNGEETPPVVSLSNSVTHSANVSSFQPPTFCPPINQGEQQPETTVVKPLVHPIPPSSPQSHTSPPPSPRPVQGARSVSEREKGGQRNNKQPIIILVVIALLVGGWLVYQNWGMWFGQPESISLDKSTISFDVKDASEQIIVTILPDYIPKKNKTITWKSSDTSIAKVDENGVVTAIAIGNTQITASTDNGLSASCNIAVAIIPDLTILDNTVSTTETRNSISDARSAQVKRPTAPTPTPVILNDLLNKITNSDDKATDDLRRVLGNRLPVVGAENISNVQQLITDVSNGSHYYITKVNTDADGKIISITVSK